MFFFSLWGRTTCETLDPFTEDPNVRKGIILSATLNATVLQTHPPIQVYGWFGRLETLSDEMCIINLVNSVFSVKSNPDCKTPMVF